MLRAIQLFYVYYDNISGVVYVISINQIAFLHLVGMGISVYNGLYWWSMEGWPAMVSGDQVPNQCG